MLMETVHIVLTAWNSPSDLCITVQVLREWRNTTSVRSLYCGFWREQETEQEVPISFLDVEQYLSGLTVQYGDP